VGGAAASEEVPRLRSDEVRSAHGSGDCLVVASAHFSERGWLVRC